MKDKTKMKHYDPRCREYVESNNPMIIWGHLCLINEFTTINNKEFWDRITVLANYADEYVDVETCYA